MAKQSHTPGPWTASFSFHGTKPGIGDVWQIDAENHAVCTTQFCYAAETEANARLIAAAPELLEAASEALKGLELAGFDRSRQANGLRAAIAKATGGSV